MTEQAPDRGPWERFDAAVILEQRAAALARKGETEEKPDKGWRSKLPWVALDVVAAALWIYGPLKIFVADVDRWLLERVAPGWLWVLDIRLLLLLAVLSVLLLFRSQTKKWFWAPVYILLFPFIVLGFKLPRFLYRRRDWTLVLGLLHVVTVVTRGMRFGVPALTLAAAGTLLALAPNSEGIRWLGVGLIALVWTASLIRAIALAFRPSRFVVGQRRLVQRVLEGDFAWKWFQIDEDLRDPTIERYDAQQAAQLMLRAESGLLAYRGAQFWAIRLDEYRRSSVSVAFNVVGIALLMVQAVATFTVINWTLIDLRPDLFIFDRAPGVATVVYYSFAALTGGEVAAVAPAGGIAALTNVFAAFSAGFLLLVLVVTLIFGFRQSKDEEATRREIGDIRRRADDFAERLGKEHNISLEEMSRLVSEVPHLLAGLVAYFTREVVDRGISES